MKRQFDATNKNTQISLIKQKILNLSNELLQEQAYYKSFHFKKVDTKNVAPPSNQPKEISKNQTHIYKEKWREIAKKIRKNSMKAHRAAFLIQTMWKQVNDISFYEINSPDLTDYFHINLSEYQKAELLVCHQIADDILNSTIEHILIGQIDEESLESSCQNTYVEEEEEDYGD